MKTLSELSVKAFHVTSEIYSRLSRILNNSEIMFSTDPSSDSGRSVEIKNLFAGSQGFETYFIVHTEVGAKKIYLKVTLTGICVRPEQLYTKEISFEDFGNDEFLENIKNLYSNIATEDDYRENVRTFLHTYKF